MKQYYINEYWSTCGKFNNIPDVDKQGYNVNIKV